MPENPHDTDLEQRRKLLEERRRMLEQRRLEISRARPGAGPAEAPPPPGKPSPTSVPAVPPPPPKPEAGRVEPTKAPTGPPPKQGPPPAPPKAAAKPPEPPPPAARPTPKQVEKAPEKPKAKAPEKPEPKPSVAEPVPPRALERPTAGAKPEVAKAAAPPKRSPLPLIIGGGVVALAVIIGLVVTLSGKKAGETARIGQAQAESLRVVQAAHAQQDSMTRALELQASTAVTALRERLAEADRLQAANRAKADYDKANDYLEEAVQLTSQGNHELALQRAQSAIEHIDSAIDRSRRIQEREDLANKDRDEALAKLQGDVAALQESISVLKTSGGSALAGVQVQQLEQIVGKARQFADAGNLDGAQEQVSYAYDMASKVRFAVTDGKRQQAEAERRLAERRTQAVQDSVKKAQADSAQRTQPPTKAVATKTVIPVYPRPAMLAGISGTVEIEFEVGIDGRARDFKIVKSLGAGCDESAVDALKQWEFRPATQGGKPVPTRMRIPMVFKKP